MDKAAVAGEAKLDGKYLRSTSDQHLTPAEIALGYMNLLKADRGFRDMMTGLLLRPVFHRREPRIRVHVLTCWLALLLTRVAEEATGDTWNTVNTHMSRIAAGHPDPARPAPLCKPPNSPTNNGQYWRLHGGTTPRITTLNQL